jgi:hypothetical protein
MISKEEQQDLDNIRIEYLIGQLNNIQGSINSYIDHAEEFSEKYSLEEVLPDLNSQKEILLTEIQSLGGTWPITN